MSADEFYDELAPRVIERDQRCRQCGRAPHGMWILRACRRNPWQPDSMDNLEARCYQISRAKVQKGCAGDES